DRGVEGALRAILAGPCFAGVLLYGRSGAAQAACGAGPSLKEIDMKKRLLMLAAAVALAGCAQFRTPEPGISTAQLEKEMGPAADKRVHSDGETWYYYPRQPH